MHPRLRRRYLIQVLAVMATFTLVHLPQPCAPQPQLQVTVGTDKTQYSPGEKVTIAGTVLSPSAQPVPDVEVSIQVSNPLGGVARIAFETTNSSGQYTDQFSLEQQTPSGTYNVDVIASKEGYSDGVAEAIFQVQTETPDFTVTLQPEFQSITQGQTAHISVTISAKLGFSQPVELSYTNVPPLSICTFSDPVVQPNSTSTATIVTSPNTPPDYYTVTVTGTGGGKVHSASALLDIASVPDLTISISPATRSLLAGEETTFNVTLIPAGGFSSSVTLTISPLP